MKSLLSSELWAGIKSRWLLWAAVLLLITYALSRRWDPPQEQVHAGRATASDEGRPAELVAWGWVSTNEIRAGETLQLWATFHNASAGQVKGLRFQDFRAPGFSRSGDCWLNGFPACISKQSNQLLPQLLEPGASVTVSGDLVPAKQSGRYGLSLVFAWSNPAGGELRKALVLGPVEVTTWWREALMTLTRRLHGFAKDFALPVAVVLLTVLFNNLQTERERKRAAADQKRAQIHDTWSNLLPQFLTDTQAYYMPLNAKLNRLRLAMREARTGEPKELRLRLYFLMSFLRQMKSLSESIGGVHFKSRSGERVAGFSWEAFRYHVHRRLRVDRVVGALSNMEAKEDLGKFEARFGGESQDSPPRVFLELESSFREWLDDFEDPFERVLPFLDILYLIISFEVNRPFEPWYGKPPDFPHEGLVKAKSELPLEPRTTVVPLHEKLDQYIQEWKDEQERKPGENR